MTHCSSVPSSWLLLSTATDPRSYKELTRVAAADMDGVPETGFKIWRDPDTGFTAGTLLQTAHCSFQNLETRKPDQFCCKH